MLNEKELLNTVEFFVRLRLFSLMDEGIKDSWRLKNALVVYNEDIVKKITELLSFLDKKHINYLKALINKEFENIIFKVISETAGNKEIDEKDYVSALINLQKSRELTEKDIIIAALNETEGNRTKAAEKLQMSRRNLLYKMKRYGIK